MINLRRRDSLVALLLSPAARPLRFAGTGLVAAATQLLLLGLFTRTGWGPLEAEASAFLLAAQVNFGLSMLFTWRDRVGAGTLLSRWLFFHGSISMTACLNLATFALARPILPLATASLLGIVVGSIGNYFVGDLLVFRRKYSSTAMGPNGGLRLRYSDATD